MKFIFVEILKISSLFSDTRLVRRLCRAAAWATPGRTTLGRWPHAAATSATTPPPPLDRRNSASSSSNSTSSRHSSFLGPRWVKYIYESWARAFFLSRYCFSRFSKRPITFPLPLLLDPVF